MDPDDFFKDTEMTFEDFINRLYNIKEFDQTGNPVMTYVPQVEYAYTFGGQTLTGEKFTLVKQKYSMKESAQSALEGLAVGQTHEIRMNPGDRKDTVLKPDYSLGFILGFTIGPLVFVGLFFGLSHFVKE